MLRSDLCISHKNIWFLQVTEVFLFIISSTFSLFVVVDFSALASTLGSHLKCCCKTDIQSILVMLGVT